MFGNDVVLWYEVKELSSTIWITSIHWIHSHTT